MQAKRHGTGLRWQKFQVLAAQSAGDACAPGGSQLNRVESMQYLCAQLTADANMSHELGRQFGGARRSFTVLRKAWGHSYLTWKRMLRMRVGWT